MFRRREQGRGRSWQRAGTVPDSHSHPHIRCPSTAAAQLEGKPTPLANHGKIATQYSTCSAAEFDTLSAQWDLGFAVPEPGMQVAVLTAQRRRGASGRPVSLGTTSSTSSTAASSTSSSRSLSGRSSTSRALARSATSSFQRFFTCYKDTRYFNLHSHDETPPRPTTTAPASASDQTRLPERLDDSSDSMLQFPPYPSRITPVRNIKLSRRRPGCSVRIAPCAWPPLWPDMVPSIVTAGAAGPEAAGA